MDWLWGKYVFCWISKISPKWNLLSSHNEWLSIKSNQLSAFNKYKFMIKVSLCLSCSRSCWRKWISLRNYYWWKMGMIKLVFFLCESNGNWEVFIIPHMMMRYIFECAKNTQKPSLPQKKRAEISFLMYQYLFRRYLNCK